MHGQRNIKFSRLDYQTLEGTTDRLRQKVGNQLPTYAS